MAEDLGGAGGTGRAIVPGTPDWDFLVKFLHGTGQLHGSATADPTPDEFKMALRRWQLQNGLPASGEYDPKTEAAVGQALAGLPHASPGVEAQSAAPAAATPEAPAAAPASPPEDPGETILREYPGFAPFLDNPELGPILTQAAKEGWSIERLQQKIQGTNWWKTTAETARIWDAETKTDPASASQKLFQMVGEIDRLARRNGVALTPHDLYVMGGNALRFGWTGEDITRAVAEQLKSRAATGLLPAGDAANNADELAKTARAYLVPMTRPELETWALKIMDGTSTMERFKSRVTQLAKQRFATDPDMLSAIDQGFAPAEYLGPIRNQVASILGKDPTTIDFLNPRYMGLTQMVDPKTGAKRAMTLQEASDWSWKQEEARFTPHANELGATLATTLAKTFGEIGG